MLAGAGVLSLGGLAGCAEGDNNVRIPVTMCHGLTDKLTLDIFTNYMKTASEMGFNSINYDQLYAWFEGTGTLPKHPIMFDFDHPMMTSYQKMEPVMRRYGFTGNLFVNTGFYEKICEEVSAERGEPFCATWPQIAELKERGWTIGAHTHTHPNLSALSVEDPTGEKVRKEMDTNDAIIRANLGFTPEYFAFTGSRTGSTWSTAASEEAKKRYKLGRLWIIGSQAEVDGETIRHGDFVKSDQPDETDGGPPMHTRYITKDTPRFLLPSLEMQYLIYTPDAFRAYLEGAL